MAEDKRFGITVSMYDVDDVKRVFAVAPVRVDTAKDELINLIKNNSEIKDVFQQIIDGYIDREHDSLAIRDWYFSPSEILKQVRPIGLEETVYDVEFRCMLDNLVSEDILPSLECNPENTLRDLLDADWEHGYDGSYGERTLTVSSEPYTWYVLRSTDPNSTEGRIREDLFTDFDSAELDADRLWESDLKAVYYGLPPFEQSMFVFDIIEVTLEFFDIKDPSLVPADFVQDTHWEFRDAYGIE